MPDSSDGAVTDGTQQVNGQQTDDGQGGGSATDNADLGDAGKRAIEVERQGRRDADARAKAAERELAKFRQATMTDTERQIAEAESRGKTAAAGEFGKRLARTAFDAAAGRKNPDYDIASALEYVDLSRFVGDDGEPDEKAIKAAVDRLVPAPQGGPPGFDGGARGTAGAAPSMNALLRQAAGRA